MFSDPQTLTINAVAKVLPRIKSDGLLSVYSMPDETVIMTLSHQKSKQRIRSMMRVDQRLIVADPLTAVNDFETLSIYLVVDRPEVGFSATQVDQLVTAFKTWCDSTALGKIYGQES